MLYIDMPQTMHTIRYLESNHCKYQNHNSDAVGCYGLRPMAAETVGYKEINSKNEDKIAFKYANFILDQAEIKSRDFLVYGWFNGPFAAKKLAEKYNYGQVPYRNPFSEHWYVKRFYENFTPSSPKISYYLALD